MHKITLLLAFVLLGCGAREPEPKAPTSPAPSTEVPAPAAAPAAPAAEAGAGWRDDFSKDEAVAFMKTRVMPRLGKVFQEHDAKRYAEASCKTCHGPQYKEPRDYLPKLTRKGGQLAAFTEKPEVAKFMAERVVPEMAAAMGQKPFDPATKTGFGCAGCHRVE